MSMPITMLNGMGCPDCNGGCSRSMPLRGLGADPIELNKQTYRTRKAISSYLMPDWKRSTPEVLRNYKAGDVVGQFIESKTFDNKLYFRTNYGGWLPYEYDNFYYANLKEVKLTDQQKYDILMDAAKHSTPGASTTVDVVNATTEVVDKTAHGAFDLLDFFGDITKNAKWILIGGVAIAGGVVAYKVYKDSKSKK